MFAILTVLAVVVLSVLVTRVAGIALTLTGLPRETARFQAQSAFTGVGFTTREAESVTIHPDRRRIVLSLMLMGNAGIASAIAGLMISFLDPGGTPEALRRGAVLVGGRLPDLPAGREARGERAHWAARAQHELDLQRQEAG
jgi:hypothetical protein